MTTLETRIRNTGLILSLMGIAACLLILLFPEIRTSIIGICMAVLHHTPVFLNPWHQRFLWWAIGGLIGFICLLFSCIQTLEPCIHKYARPPVLLALLSVLIFVSIVVRIIMYAKVRSLWGDEVALAESLVRRNFQELFASPLEHGQTAPALYLVTVKAICTVFGYTEGALRIFSLFAFFGVLVCEILLLRKVFQVDFIYALLAAAITATFPLFMRYSNEFKPYMGDAFFVLAVLLIYHGYSAGSLKLPIATLLYSIILLFSSPALFFIASVFTVEFILKLIEKNWKQVWKVIIAGIITLAVFIVYYMLWLMPVAENPGMVNYWKYNCFYVFTFELGKIKNNLILIGRMLGIPGCLYFFFALMGFVISVRKKNKLAFVTGLSVLLLLIASNLEKYPIEKRLYLFIYPIIIIFMVICFSSIVSKNMAGALAVLCVALNIGFLAYAGDELYLKTCETNPLIAYIREHIKDDEYVYVYSGAVTIVRFKNGYNTAKIGNVPQDNIIYGKNYWNVKERKLSYILYEFLPENFEQDIEKILEAKKCYLLFAHQLPEQLDTFIERLKTLGSIEEVMNVHGTPLYYFTAGQL